MLRSTINWRSLSIASFLFLAVFCVFLPCLWNDFSNFDDPTYVTANPHIHRDLNWSAIRWAFTEFYSANWHPITWLSHMVDFTLYGREAWGHHLTSVIFHSANVSLLFLILSEATGSTWRSAIVAILFGVHPLHVESVAWIAERKDVLNTFFALLTMFAYLRWTQNVDRRSRLWYFGALFSFALSLGSKAMSITLPVLLLLLDYWPLRRISSWKAGRRVLVEKIPFLCLSIIAGVITVAAQKSGGAINLTVPLLFRSMNAVVSILAYLSKLFWPHDLAVYYPYSFLTWGRVIFCVLIFLSASVASLLWRRSRPWIFVGWWWFVVSLLPVIGIVQVGSQAMADRYMYLPSIGLFVAFVWIVADLLERVRLPRLASAAVGCLVGTAFAGATIHQIRFWRNSETLFEHALAVTANNPIAHLNLGAALGDRGASSEAEMHLREAVRLDPTSPDGHLNLGIVFHQTGKVTEAISELETCLRLRPDYARARANLGIALYKQNDFERAIDQYREALRLDPSSPDVRVGFGLALQSSGQVDAALAQFEEAIKEYPSYAGAHSNRGIVLEKLGRLEESITEYRKAISLDPKNSDASLNLPVVLFKAGHVDDAIAQVRKLIEQRPDYAEAYFNLGGMLYSKDDFDGAIAAYKRALELKPDYPDASHNLNVALEGKSSAKR